MNEWLSTKDLISIDYKSKCLALHLKVFQYQQLGEFSNTSKWIA